MTDFAGKRVAGYARYSTDRQNAASIDGQIEKLRQYVAARCGTLDDARVFADEAVSGAVRERPGLTALVRAIELRDVDVIVTEDLGRISRDVEDLSWFRKRCAHYDVRLLAIDDGIDSSNDGAELMGDVLGGFKALYRREIAKKTRRGMQRRASQGFATGQVPFGYSTRRVPYQGGEASEILIDDEHARIVREVFAMYADDGLSLASIARALNEREVAPPRSSRRRAREAWQVSTVRSILHNPAYSGAWSYGRREWKRDPDTRRRLPRERAAALETMDRPELAIIDRATWERVCARFADTSTTYTGRRVIPTGQRFTYPLSGVLRCGSCESLFTITGGEEGRRYYRCSGAIRGKCEVRTSLRESVVRERILGAIRERFASPDAQAEIEALVREELALADGHDTRRRDLADRVSRSEARVRRLVLAVADGAAPASVLATIADLEAQVAEDRAELARVVEAEDARPSLEVPSAAEVCASFAAFLSGPAAAVRAALRRMLDGGHVDVHRAEDGTLHARGGLLPGFVLGREVSTIAGAHEAREYGRTFRFAVNLAA